MSDCLERQFGSDDSNIYDVEFVYGKKMFKKKTFYAVKWLGWTKQQMSWEPISNFTSISSYLVKRLETRLCYALYYKRIAPSTSGIRVHIIGKFCQVQQIDTNLKQKTIVCEKIIASHSIDASSPYDKAEKIITQMKQNLLISNNNMIHQKIQKKVNKQKKHLRKILNLQEKNDIISIRSLSPKKNQENPNQSKKRGRQNRKKIVDLELEKDIQLLIQNEQQQQQQQQLIQQQQKQNNNIQNISECQIILNEPDNSEQAIAYAKETKVNKYLEKQIKLLKRNGKQVLKKDKKQEQSKIQNLSSSNIQETLSQYQEESLEIDLLITENNEYLEKSQKFNDTKKSKDIQKQNVVQLSTCQQKDQFPKLRVVKSVLNPKIIKNITQVNSDINQRIEKKFISEIMEEEQKRQTEIWESIHLKQFVYKEPKIQPSIKTSQQIQQEIQKLQLEKIALNRTSRCSVLVIPRLKDAEVQYNENSLFNNEIVQYDVELNEVKFQKIIVENIESHNYFIGKLLFRCLYDNGIEYYVEYDILQKYCPTLLLDYMIVNSILI